MHGLLTEPEISGQMGYIGLSLGVYSHEGNGGSNFVLSEGAFYVGIFVRHDKCHHYQTGTGVKDLWQTKNWIIATRPSCFRR